MPAYKNHHTWSHLFAKLNAAGARQFQFFLSFLIAFAVLGLSFYYRSALFNTLLHVDPWWIGTGLICYGINYILRAFRLRILAGHRVSFWPQAVYASSLHGFMTYLIPLQAGDISLPVILKAIHGIALSDGSAILIRVRLLDMVSLGIMILAAATLFNIALDLSIRLLWFSTGGCLVLGPFILRGLIAGNWIQSKRFGIFLKPFAMAGKFKLGECALSLGIWIAVASVFFCVVRAINLPIGFGGILLLITIQLPLQVLPVQGVANTGNHEGGWIAALSLLGVPLSQSAKFAVTSHIIILFYVLALGILTLVIGPKKLPFSK